MSAWSGIKVLAGENKSVKLNPMNELSNPHSACPIVAQEDINHQTRTFVPEILPDNQIDPFHIYETATVGPVVLSVPHGGWQYPQSLVTTDNLKRCVSLTDTGTAELGTMLAGSSFPVLIASCGRAACDLNRSQDALDALLCAKADVPVPISFRPYVAAGYGVIPRLSADRQPLYERVLEKAQWRDILNNWHVPYHRILADLLHLARLHHENVFLIDLHSMPDNPSRKSLFPATSRRLPDFVFGNLHGATMTQNTVGLINTVMEKTRFSWHWNTPYAGGYITRHYGLNSEEDKLNPPVEVLQIEVNRRLYTTKNFRLNDDRIRAVNQVIKLIINTLSVN